uniref:Leucine rich repeat containing 23 n=1 Tax=Crocodylus porosus TaxID=8502 RepID=A0A7M4EAW3_CROPO
MSDEEFDDESDANELEKEGEDGEEEKESAELEEEVRKQDREMAALELISNPLTEEIMKEGLSLLCKTGNGLAHAYVKLEAKEKDLTDIGLLQNYIHLRYVDLSENQLRDLSPLGSLIHLLWLKVDGNRLTSATLQELPYLQIASFAHNRIKDTEGISHPRLGSLNLKGMYVLGGSRSTRTQFGYLDPAQPVAAQSWSFIDFIDIRAGVGKMQPRGWMQPARASKKF